MQLFSRFRVSRTALIAGWCVVLLGLLGLHFGPGQRAVSAQRIDAQSNAALAAEQMEDWGLAVEKWTEALSQTEANAHDERARLALRLQMARVMKGELPEALEATAALHDEVLEQDVTPETEEKVRAQLAAMHYWAAWLMRLEGATAEEWEPVADMARMHFRKLAESDSGDADEHKKNLESVIRLQRMDLSELRGMPLPKECKNTKNCTGKCKSQREARCKGEGDKDGQGEGEDDKEDGRDKVKEEKAKGAGQYNRSDKVGW